MNFQPIYFSSEHGQLYGVHHFPAKEQANQQAILIIPPMGHEYVRCHKTLQKLALDLSDNGFHVLRFDYAGTGDSNNPDNWDLETWKSNALEALRELSERSETHELSVVGVRLGASLAISLKTTLRSLVLWDPIIRGDDYLGELKILNAELLETTIHSSSKNSPPNGATDELVGYHCTESMQESLRHFSLSTNLHAQSDRILWIESSDRSNAKTTSPILEELNGSKCQHHALDMNCHWNTRAELPNTMMGQPATRVILEFFRNRDAH